MQRYLLVLVIDNLDELKKIFGNSIIREVKKRIDDKFEEITEKLLTRHKILSRVNNTSFNCWKLSFGMEESNLMVDSEEQKKTIIQAGEKLIRKMLKEEFGAATSQKVKFKFTTLSYPEDISSDRLDLYIKDKIKEESPSRKRYKDIIQKEELVDVIEVGKLNTYLQPLLSLPEEETIGYEVLTRGPKNSDLFGAGNLFGAADYFDLTEELELACIRQGLEEIAEFPQEYNFSLNIGPQLLLGDRFYRLITEDRFRQILPQIIFEITEHLPLELVKDLRERINRLKELRVSIALDDVGCGFFDRTAIKRLRPKLVKLCITVINKADKSTVVQRDICKTINEIKEFGSVVLAEGVERKEQIKALNECGIDLAQGYYYCRPQPAVEFYFKTRSQL